MSNNFNKGTRRVDDAVKINKSLLIVKSQAQNLLPVENFLRNREWKIFSTTSVKDALQHMIQHQPGFVMISVDHPNKKVRNLPKVLAQAFPCCVISFAENSSSASFQNLTESRSEYLLYPPVTGPAVERTVNKYYKDQANKGMTPLERDSSYEDGGDANISIKGSAAAQNLLAQLMGEDAPAASGIPGNETAGSSGSAAYTPSSQTSGAANGGPNYVPSSNNGGPAYGGGPGSGNGPQGSAGAVGSNGQTNGQYVPTSGDGNSPGGFIPGQSPNGHGGANGQAGPHGAYGQNGNGTNGPGLGGMNGMGGPGSGRNPNDPNYDPNRDPNYADGSYAGGKSGEQADPNYDQPYHRKNKENKGSWQALDPKEKPRPGRETDEDGFIRTKNHQDSIILKGTKEALDKSVYVSGKPDEPVHELREASNVACIVIESSRFSGYLVAAMGKDRKIDEAFVKRIRDRLFGFLAANGEPVSEEESMGIKIKEVPFEDWALECAEFLRKSVHNGDEVAMAFFPYADVKAKVEQSASEEMVAVSLDEIKVDVPVEMNLYIYLPTNQKYVLYTPRGGKMYDKQKEKLSKQGVTQMHMLKHEVGDFNKYRAQNYLNGKIEEYENVQKIRKMAG